MQTHEKMMQRCLDLAENGASSASPNPMVGCVIVAQDKIIGEGWHYQAGQPHAEVNAINAVENLELLPESTLYVNLEPCAHYGKTPPCANLIVEKGIKKVVVGCLDPNKEVSGKGIAILQAAGVAVEVGILESESLYLNRKFIHFQKVGLPYITLKWAESADGFMDVSRSHQQKGSVAISCPESRIFAHKLRAEHDAILVGSQTALVDNPSLTTRLYAGKNPVRLILDRRNRVPDSLVMFGDDFQTWHFTTVGQNRNVGAKHRVVLAEENFVKNALSYCASQGIQSILVEGGAMIHDSFIEEDLWQEAFVITAPKMLEDGLLSPIILGDTTNEFRLGVDVVTQYINKK